MKKSPDGLLFALSKPKMWGGPIHAEYLAGDQEIYLIPCPHCGTMQEITWESLKFDHCKDLLGQWDKGRVLRETYVKCHGTFCTAPIEHRHLRAIMENDLGHWMPTARGDPDIISMHMSDYYDAETPNIWGQIALERINAKGDPVKEMGVVNHRDGKPYRPKTRHTDRATILGLREPYKRGTIPFAPWFKLKDIFPDDETITDDEAIVPLILGGDTQQDFSPWAVGALGPGGELALIDWGRELHPNSLVKIAMDHSWPIAADPACRQYVCLGGIDSPFRKEDVHEACLHSRKICWPVVGVEGLRSRGDFSLNQIPTYDRATLMLISFNNFDFSAELILERIPTRRLWVPVDIEQRQQGESNYDIVAELCAERLEENSYGHFRFTNAAPGQKRGRANHFFDCTKIICLMWRYMMRKRDPEAGDIPGPESWPPDPVEKKPDLYPGPKTEWQPAEGYKR